MAVDDNIFLSWSSSSQYKIQVRLVVSLKTLMMIVKMLLSDGFFFTEQKISVMIALSTVQALHLESWLLRELQQLNEDMRNHFQGFKSLLFYKCRKVIAITASVTLAYSYGISCTYAKSLCSLPTCWSLTEMRRYHHETSKDDIDEEKTHQGKEKIVYNYDTIHFVTLLSK